jgi:two-component SAPR family response regulator
MKPTFIVVDDDSLHNMLCSLLIKKSFVKADVDTFTNPETALGYMLNAYSETDAPDTIVFLDINMPILSGWEFLDAFDKFDDQLKKKFRIHMLSSSIDPYDRRRSKGNKNVLSYIEKPLTTAKLESVIIEQLKF